MNTADPTIQFFRPFLIAVAAVLMGLGCDPAASNISRDAGPIGLTSDAGNLPPTCSVSVMPETGTSTTPFSVASSSNAKSCTWAVDGVEQSVVSCSGVLENNFFNDGPHVITLKATGSGGTSVCTSNSVDVIDEAVPTLPTCAISVSPTIGTVSTSFTASVESTGSECSLQIDDAEAASVPCNSASVALIGAALQTPGLHTARLNAKSPPSGGDSMCISNFTVEAANATTCAVTATPPAGTTSSTFAVQFASNGTACTWAIDGVDKGPVDCNAAAPTVTAGQLGGVGSHTLTLKVTAGPGGPADCNGTIAVTPADETSCSIAVSPSTGTEATAYALNVQSNGTKCSWSVDAADAGTPIDCVTQNKAVTAADFGGPGQHTVSISVEEGPSGPKTCSAAVTVQPNASTTCAVAVTPSTGAVNLPFTIQTTSNGSDCTWNLDGAPKGSVACNQFLSATGDKLGGIGTHTLELLVPNGPGGTAICSTSVTVTEATPTCNTYISPSTGYPETNFKSIWTSSNSTSCTWSLDGAPPQTVPCSGTKSFLGAAAGVGSHSVTFTATGSGGSKSCTSGFTIKPTPAPTCSGSVTPATGTVNTDFSVVWSSKNATKCTWTFDGVDKGEKPCSESGIIQGFYPGIGNHTALLTATGPGGTGSCSVSFTVKPTCQGIISPSSGSLSANTQFTIAYLTDATSCTFQKNGAGDPLPVDCKNSPQIVPASWFGVGTGKTVTLNATALGQTSTCASNSITINP